MSTASSGRPPAVPPPTNAQPAQPGHASSMQSSGQAAAPAGGGGAVAPAAAASAADSATRPAGKQSSQAADKQADAHKQQQKVAPGAAPGASHAAPNGTKPSSSSSSSSSHRVPSFAAATAQLLATRPPLPVSSRSNYKTFILSHGVFEVESRYSMRELIGQGAYGVVCSALDLKRGSMVAVKKIENVFDHRSLAKRTLREIKILRYLVHENILGIERVIRPHSDQFNNIYMVSELMETDLACVIRSPQELTDEHTQFFIYQVLRGLKYIHSANVIHRDLKPRNLLVRSNCDLKICDFGLARVDDPQHRDRASMSNYIATRWYRAPEVICGRKQYTKAVDMWSVGCILAELLGRKPIFPGKDSFHQITLICGILGTPHASELRSASVGAGALPPKGAPLSASSTAAVSDDYISRLPRKPKVPFLHLYPRANPLACDLLDKLLLFDPEKRLTVEQALAHPYLADLHCEEDEPVCTALDLSDFFWEFLPKLSKDDLRYLIHQEVVQHYAEEKFEPPHKAKDALANFTAGMGAALPKGRKVRRKSI